MSECSRVKKEKKASWDSWKSPYHDDEEVEHTYPAQPALDQGHQVLEDDRDINSVNCQSVGVTAVLTTAV